MLVNNKQCANNKNNEKILKNKCEGIAQQKQKALYLLQSLKAKLFCKLFFKKKFYKFLK